jgi:hypothetical protein
MAEKVVITNGNLDGSVLENAASEATLLRLVTLMDRKFGKGSNQLDKAQELYTKRLSESNTELQHNATKTKDLNKAVDSQRVKYTQAADDFKAVLTKLSNGISKTIDYAFSGTETSIGQFSSAIGSQIPIVGGIISALGNAVDGQINAFRQLSQSGISLGEGLNQAQQAAARTGLPFNVLTKSLSENSRAFALLSGDASSGAQRFINISENLKKSGFTERMGRLGLTMQEGAELTAGYLEVQSKLGRSQKMTDAELTKGTEDYILQLDELSRVTGMSRKEAQDSLKQQQLDKRVRTVTQGMNEKQLKEYQKSIAALEKFNPELNEVFKELVATGGIPVSEAAKSLARSNPEFVKAAGNMKRHGGSFDALAVTVRAGANRLNGMGEGFIDTASTLAGLNKNMAMAGYFMVQGGERFGEGLTEVQQQQAKEMEDRTRNAANFDKALTSLKNKLSVALLPFMDDFTKALEIAVRVLGNLAVRAIPYIGVFADNLGKALVKVNEFVNYLLTSSKEGFIKDAANAIFKTLGDVSVAGIKTLWENPKILGALAAGVASFFAYAVAKAAAVKAVSSIGQSVAEKLTGRVFSTVSDKAKDKAGDLVMSGAGKVADKTKDKLSTGRSTAGSNVGNAAATIGTGIGKGLGGLSAEALKGVASGLSAFANPKILVGAGILGASVTVIGAGIAGAAWLTGKAMPTFAEGLQLFGSIDGGKLISVAKGAAAMGAAIAVFGAGSAIGSAGSVISSLGNSLSGLFGAKSLNDKLKEFAALGPGMTQSAAGFNSFSVAMVNFNRSNISDSSIKKIEIGTNRLRALAAAGRETAEAFKRLEPSMLDRLGDKITSITSSLKEVGANISSSVSAALSGDTKKTNEQLLTDLNNKIDRLNTSVAQLVTISSNSARDMSKTAKNTRTTAGSVY